MKEAKSTKLQEDCKGMEALQEKCDSFNEHKRVKEAAGIAKDGIRNSKQLK